MQPISNLTLYNCKLDHTGQKTIDFTNGATRDSYFSSNNAIATIYSTPFVSNAYFIRENKTIKIGINADLLDANGVNYCRFNNPQSGTSQFFYCFIDDIEYSAPQTSILHIRTDVWLTNFDRVTPDYCFVEREHVLSSEDTFYKQLTPETVDLGDILKWDISSLSGDLGARSETEFNTNYIVVVCMSARLVNYPYTLYSYFGGVPNACYYYAFDSTAIRSFFEEVDTGGQADAVISVYAVPRNYITLNNTGITISDHTIYQIDDIDYTNYYTVSKSMNSSSLYNGYTPRNNKLYSYPYNYLKLYASNGSSIDLKYENTVDKSGTINFTTVCDPSPNGGLWCIPGNYDTNGSYPSHFLGDYENAVEYNGFSEIAYKSNAYLNYIALNKNSLGFEKIMNQVSVAKGAVNSLIGGGNDVLNEMESSLLSNANRAVQIADMQSIPDKIHGTVSGNLKSKSCASGIFCARMCIRYEYAEKIDKYFDVYGYNVSEVKLPQWTNRPHYNYIKTHGINVYGLIPKNDKKEIENLIDNGLTVWHISSGGTYGLYDTSNK